MARYSTGADRPSSAPPVDAGAARGSLRAAAGTMLLGGLVFFAGVSRPVVGDWAAAFEDEAKRIAIAKADADQFTVGFALMGVGFILMGIALGLWGRAVARLETGRRATAAVVLALASAIGGSGRAWSGSSPRSSMSSRRPARAERSTLPIYLARSPWPWGSSGSGS